MAKKLTGAAAAAVPVAAGGLVTVAATLGLRAFLTPEPGTTSEQLYRWAPAIGAGVGLLGAGAMVMLAGKSKGMTMGVGAALAAVIVGGALLGSERLNAAKPGAALALGGGMALPAGTSGLAALLPEYANMNGGMGAIVMDQLNGPYGDSVQVAGLNGSVRTDAFGDSPF
jgi:hypothetical protein